MLPDGRKDQADMDTAGTTPVEDRRSRGFVARLRVLALLALAGLGASAYGADRASAAKVWLYMQSNVDGINGHGTVTENTSAHRMGCTYPNYTICFPDYGWGWTVELQATPAPGWRFAGWAGAPSWASPPVNNVGCD